MGRVTNPAPAQAGELPKYRLTEPAYIDDVYYDQRQVDSGQAIIYSELAPGVHMQPLNDAAKAMVERHHPKAVDPLRELSIVGQQSEKRKE